MSEHKTTYPVEVEYLDGTKETIEFPRISSESFFDAYVDPKFVAAQNVSPEASMMMLIKALINGAVPGLLSKVTVASGMTLLNTVAENEAGALSLGEAPGTVQKKATGRSKTKKS